MDSPLDLPPLHLPSLLRAHGLKPNKGLGQNFLLDESMLQAIVRSADIPSGVTVLEVGAGVGSLTRRLASSAQRVVAVELDSSLFPILCDVMAPWQNVQLIQGDILQQDIKVLMGADKYLVVANIPYYITAALIRFLLENENKPSRLVLTVQKEVAERICACPGEMSLLSLSVQVYGSALPVLHIPAEAFYPVPKVDSTTLRIDLYPQPLINPHKLDMFFTLVRAGFSQKRKMLRNSLAAGLKQNPLEIDKLLDRAGIDSKRRAETLSISEWAAITDIYNCK
jgi:16S rRNA (adenine1518-N6/adenine1519-N6)-dimethyltransferase